MDDVLLREGSVVHQIIEVPAVTPLPAQQADGAFNEQNMLVLHSKGDPKSNPNLEVDGGSANFGSQKFSKFLEI